MRHIHPTALVDPKAELADEVSIGPFTVVGPNVRIGKGTTIGPHCVIEGHTSLGEHNRVWQFCSLGAAPQDKKYRDEPTQLVIGHRNTVREFCTFNTGTAQDAGATRIGNDNWIMAYVHLAHDCQVGDQTIFANNAQLAGHVHVGDWAILGGFTVVHQFVHIGAHSMTAMCSLLFADLPPFMMAQGQPAATRSFNAEGLRRRGYSPERLALVKTMHKLLFRDGLTLEQARAQIAALSSQDAKAQADLALMQTFLARSAAGQRGIAR